MNDVNSEKSGANQVPMAAVRSGRSLSIIWVVPVIALLIGSWLALKAWSEKGPVITIAFQSAEGLEANKTKIKFKDVEIGKVTRIVLNDDLSKVIVTAEMNRDAEKFMREKTEFWVVRARVAAGEVSGLGTLFSGAYIGCNPSKEGKATHQFIGLEKPPVVTAGMSGRQFVLVSDTLGFLDVGSPVYYRGIKVGQVVGYDFDETAESVNIRVFVNSPYQEKVRQNSRFWNASGFDVKLDTEGVSVDAQSLVTIILGGVAFDLPDNFEPSDQAEANRTFNLYEKRQQIEERIYKIKRFYLMYFDQNVRGLESGAPVEIRGIKIGEVVDVKLEVNMDDITARVAVLVAIEPERIDTIIAGKHAVNGNEQSVTAEQTIENVARMVDKGLRAQVKTGNLLTGQLYIDLDFYPKAMPDKVGMHNGYPVMPTLPAPFEQIAQRVNNILKQVEKMPLEQIGQDLHRAIKSLDRTLATVEQTAGGFNRDVLPELKTALADFQQTMNGVDQTLGADSAINYNARTVLGELTATLRSLRTLIDYLEQNPQSVIFGKGGAAP